MYAGSICGGLEAALSVVHVSREMALEVFPAGYCVENLYYRSHTVGNCPKGHLRTTATFAPSAQRQHLTTKRRGKVTKLLIIYLILK